MGFVLGIDFGTSGVRAIVLDAAAVPCAEVALSLPASVHQQGQWRQTPADWWQALDKLMQMLGQQIDLQQIESLLLDGTSATLLLADKRGQALTPALMYNDNSSIATAAQIAKYANPNSAAQGASSSLAKALALLKTTDKAAYVLHQADWLLNRLCGRFGHSDYNNALKLGFDPVALGWESWLERLINMDLLPQVHAPASILGEIAPQWARAWGLNPKLKILAGTTDSTASFIAAGACENGEAVSALGSSLVVKILSSQPIFAPKLGVYSHRLGQHWLVGGASNTGGAVLAQYFSSQQLQSLSAQIDLSKSCKLDYYPLLCAGERFPINDPNYPPRLSPRPADDVVFLQGLLQGISRIEAQAYQVLADLGAPKLKRLYSTGGGAANPVWTQMRQSALGVDVCTAKQQQAAYGAALLAMNNSNRL